MGSVGRGWKVMKVEVLVDRSGLNDGVTGFVRINDEPVKVEGNPSLIFNSKNFDSFLIDLKGTLKKFFK